jgi:hypothetical protein
MAAAEKMPQEVYEDSDSDDGLWKPPGGIHPSIGLPIAFKIYCRKSRLVNSEFYIGHEKGQRLHAISGGMKGWLKYKIGLHQGPSTDSPVLGSSVLGMKTIEVTLPSGTHTMHAESLLSSDYAFDFPIQGRLEHFEWQRSKGPEVESLHGRGKSGWVLLRSGQNAAAVEPVAAYSLDLTSLKLSGHFAFYNSGQTDELGAEFAVMAIITALSMGQKKRDNMVGVPMLVAIS